MTLIEKVYEVTIREVFTARTLSPTVLADGMALFLVRIFFSECSVTA